MQKFTRPITREIELAGERLALTFSEQGVGVRTVGSRKSPWEMSWAALLCHLTGKQVALGQEPSADQLAEAVRSFKTTAAPARPSTAPAAHAPAAQVRQEEAHELQPPAAAPAHGAPVSESHGLFSAPTTP